MLDLLTCKEAPRSALSRDSLSSDLLMSCSSITTGSNGNGGVLQVTGCSNRLLMHFVLLQWERYGSLHLALLSIPLLSKVVVNASAPRAANQVKRI